MNIQSQLSGIWIFVNDSLIFLPVALFKDEGYEHELNYPLRNQRAALCRVTDSQFFLIDKTLTWLMLLDKY